MWIEKEYIRSMGYNGSTFLESINLDEMWYNLLYKLYYYGRKNYIDSGSYAGTHRLEFDKVSGTIYEPTKRPLAPIVPEGVPQPTTEDKISEYFTNYLMNGECEPKEHYKYATWIVGGTYTMPTSREIVNVPNQLEWLINHYSKKGHGNNHCCIQIGYPESSWAYEVPYKNENERWTSPCLRLIDTHVKDGILHMDVTFRSWSLYSGWPENMGGLTLLGEYIAEMIGVKMGPLSFNCLKLHVYESEIESALLRRLNKLDD